MTSGSLGWGRGGHFPKCPSGSGWGRGSESWCFRLRVVLVGGFGWGDFLEEVGAFGGAGGEDDGGDASFGEVLGVHGFADLLGVLCFAEGDSGAAEAAAGHAGAEDAWEGAGDFYHEVEFLAGDFEVVAEGGVGVGHELADV